MNKEEIFFKKIAQKHNTPEKVQKLLKNFKYNSEPHGETLKSAEQTYRKKNAHCLEAAFLAAAILEHQGYPPMVMSLESIDDLDHVIFVYKKKGKWGSIARSRDFGLHGRKPVYRSIRDLALSYYEPYIDKTGCLSGYRAVNLDESKSNWRYSKKNVWKAEQFLIDIRHKKLKFNKKRYKKLHKRYLAGVSLPTHKNWL